MAPSESRSFWKAFGPGVLFAGAAVGVSHLVQSTRAGAVYGFGLLLVVVLANVTKYPAFRFGPQYAAATGTSLLEGYRRQGRWALVVYGLLTLATMFTVQAAVTVVTAGIAKALLGLTATAATISAALIAVCALMIGLGRYHWLDRVSKVVVAVLTVSTLAATALALPRVNWGDATFLPPAGAFDAKSVILVAGLVGWMPSAIDVAVWQSLWTLARRRDTGHAPSLRDSLLDFHIGYLGTAFLALCFLTLGAGVMHGRGIPFQDSAGGFAAQVISLYTETLGEWSRPLIGLAAFSVMFSTTLTVVDGFPRALGVLAVRFRAPERPGDDVRDTVLSRSVYWGSLVTLALGSYAIIGWWLTSLKGLVDVATTLSFLTAPILAVLNHRAIMGPEVPAEFRPGRGLVALSWASTAFLFAFAGYYLWIRFSS